MTEESLQIHFYMAHGFILTFGTNVFLGKTRLAGRWYVTKFK